MISKPPYCPGLWCQKVGSAGLDNSCERPCKACTAGVTVCLQDLAVNGRDNCRGKRSYIFYIQEKGTNSKTSGFTKSLYSFSTNGQVLDKGKQDEIAYSLSFWSYWEAWFKMASQHCLLDGISAKTFKFQQHLGIFWEATQQCEKDLDFEVRET